MPYNIPKGYKLPPAEGWEPVDTDEKLLKLLKEKKLHMFRVKGTEHLGFAKKDAPDREKIDPIAALQDLEKGKCIILETNGFMKIFKLVKV